MKRAYSCQLCRSSYPTKETSRPKQEHDDNDFSRRFRFYTSREGQGLLQNAKVFQILGKQHHSRSPPIPCRFVLCPPLPSRHQIEEILDGLSSKILATYSYRPRTKLNTVIEFPIKVFTPRIEGKTFILNDGRRQLAGVNVFTRLRRVRRKICEWH